MREKLNALADLIVITVRHQETNTDLARCIRDLLKGVNFVELAQEQQNAELFDPDFCEDEWALEHRNGYGLGFRNQTTNEWVALYRYQAMLKAHRELSK